MLGFLRNSWRKLTFRSADYWDDRYRRGGNSGAGSYSRLAEFKASVINSFVAENRISSVMELGSGDGAQLERATYPRYIGIDVSPTAVAHARKMFAADPTKEFHLEIPAGLNAELTLSLDVIYHLIEDHVFDRYMHDLFNASTRFVIIYSSNKDEPVTLHVKHRKFTDWIEANRPDATLVETVPNLYPWDPENPDHTSFADFCIYRLN